MTGENSNQTIKKQTRLVTRPAVELIPPVQRVEVTLGKINFLPTFWLAGLSEYPRAQKRQWFFGIIFYSAHIRPASIRPAHPEILLQSAFMDVNRNNLKCFSRDIFSQHLKKQAGKAVKTGKRAVLFLKKSPAWIRMAGRHSCSASMVSSISANVVYMRPSRWLDGKVCHPKILISNPMAGITFLPESPY